MSGPIHALRTFDLDSEGHLFPVAAHAAAWQEGLNSALCTRHSHAAPDEKCRCGFYAFGSLGVLTHQYRQSRQLIAVVACSGKLIPARYGLRAEKARILALWSPSAAIRSLVAASYPSAALFSSREAMLREYPTTPLPTYRLAGTHTTHLRLRQVALTLSTAALAFLFCLHVSAQASAHSLHEPSSVLLWLIVTSTFLCYLAPALSAHPRWWRHHVLAPLPALLISQVCLLTHSYSLAVGFGLTASVAYLAGVFITWATLSLRA